MENTEKNFETLACIAVDCVIFGHEDGVLKVLVRREFVPVDGEIQLEWKLPGNHVRRNEEIGETASRILKEQTIRSHQTTGIGRQPTINAQMDIMRDQNPYNLS